MITNPNIINAIAEKKLKIKELGIEQTRRCPLNCQICYKGDAENVVLDKRVPEIAFDQFNDIEAIALLGGEPQSSTKGILHILNALKENKTKFRKFGFVTSMAFINKDFWEAVDEINSFATIKNCDMDGVHYSISNDYWHNLALDQANIPLEAVAANYDTVKKAHPHLKSIHRDYIGKEQYIVSAVGHGKNIPGALQSKKFPFEISKVYKWVFPTKSFSIDRFNVDAKGNIFNGFTEYTEADKGLLGNIFKSPIQNLIIENAVDKTM